MNIVSSKTFFDITYEGCPLFIDYVQSFNFIAKTASDNHLLFLCLFFFKQCLQFQCRAEYFCYKKIYLVISIWSGRGVWVLNHFRLIFANLKKNYFQIHLFSVHLIYALNASSNRETEFFACIVITKALLCCHNVLFSMFHISSTIPIQLSIHISQSSV